MKHQPHESASPSVNGRGRWQSRRGVSTVELALTLPILLLLLLGVADFGRAYYAAIVLANAARAGAAYGSQSNAKSVDNVGIKTAAVQEGQNIGLTVNNVSTQPVCKCPTNGATINCITGSCTTTPELYVGVTARDTFTTLVNYPLLPNSIPMMRSAAIRLQ